MASIEVVYVFTGEMFSGGRKWWAQLKRQRAVSREVLMPRISCSNVIHKPSVMAGPLFDV